MSQNNQNKQIVEYKEPELTIDIIRKLICKEANDSEIMLFIEVCKAKKLNPLIGEIYLIKYGNEKAQIVINYNSLIARADLQPDFVGLKAGLVVQDPQTKEVYYPEGKIYLDNQILIGAWCLVERKNRGPYFDAVLLKEYLGRKKDGSIQKNWLKMPATMINKVAIAHVLRKAYPNSFSGLYIQEELENEYEGQEKIKEISSASSALEGPIRERKKISKNNRTPDDNIVQEFERFEKDELLAEANEKENNDQQTNDLVKKVYLYYPPIKEGEFDKKIFNELNKLKFRSMQLEELDSNKEYRFLIIDSKFNGWSWKHFQSGQTDFLQIELEEGQTNTAIGARLRNGKFYLSIQTESKYGPSINKFFLATKYAFNWFIVEKKVYELLKNELRELRKKNS